MNTVNIGQRKFNDTTHIEVATIADRNKRAPGGKARKWGMLVTVLADNKTYELKRGLVDTNKFNNNNWQEFQGSGGGSLTLKFQAFNYNNTNTGVFTINNGTINTLMLVEVNGIIQREGVDFTRALNVIDFGAVLPGSGTVTVIYFETVSGVIYEEKLQLRTVDTSVATITFDLQNRAENMFNSSASFATAKVIAINNFTGSIHFSWAFEITNIAAAFTFPIAVEMPETDLRWNAATNVWTPAATGKYELSVLNDGTNFKAVISAKYV
ncbi:MAG: hypothetical protein ACK5OS_01945 [Chryseotalea sp.]